VTPGDDTDGRYGGRSGPTPINRQRIRNYARRARDATARLALHASNTTPVKQLLAARYDNALTRHRPSLPDVSGITADIVAGLRKDGVYVTSLRALGVSGSAEMLGAGKQLAKEFAETAWEMTRNGVAFTAVPPEAIAARPQIFNWGLDDRLLDIAEAYIGLPVAYDGLNLIYTVADGQPTATRQWHRDREDRRMLKVAVYCNDVREGGGPFQLLSRLDRNQGDQRGYHYPPYTDADLARIFGPDYEREIITCMGRAGTVVIADTATYFHRGEPPVAKDRGAIFYSYFARPPRHPFFCERSGLTREQIAALSEGLPPRQRASALWREDVPAPFRLIPTASL
jgi:hypothetical protein